MLNSNTLLDSNLAKKILFGKFSEEFVDVGHPYGGRGVGGHTPVASGGETDTADLRTIGHAGTLELLGEESAVEVSFPFQYSGIVVDILESHARKKEYLAGCEAVAQCMVEEEVMKLVGTYEIFRLLGYGIGIIIARDEFRGNRRVDYIA